MNSQLSEEFREKREFRTEVLQEAKKLQDRIESNLLKIKIKMSKKMKIDLKFILLLHLKIKEGGHIQQFLI